MNNKWLLINNNYGSLLWILPKWLNLTYKAGNIKPSLRQVSTMIDSIQRLSIFLFLLIMEWCDKMEIFSYFNIANIIQQWNWTIPLFISGFSNSMRSYYKSNLKIARQYISLLMYIIRHHNKRIISWWYHGAGLLLNAVYISCIVKTSIYYFGANTGQDILCTYMHIYFHDPY